MPLFRGKKGAFGAPGANPHWSHANKHGVGTAHDLESRVWFTIWNGMLTEIYYPTVDQPQMRDVQLLFTEHTGKFFDEASMEHEIERISPAQGYRIVSRHKQNGFSYTREIIADPRRAAVLIHAQLKAADDFRAYLLCNPHMDVGGSGNNAYIVEVSGREVLVAEKSDRWMAAGASCGFSKLSCGYVAQSDGYTDLKAHGRMTFDFDEAKNGNVALTGELNLRTGHTFTVAIAFGETLSSATTCLLQSLYGDYKEQRSKFVEGWTNASKHRKSLEGESGDKGKLYHSSFNVVAAHEDKTCQGAFVASLTTPWGEVRDDKEGKGGYHLVWTRDMVQSAMGLLAAGDITAPERALVYLAALQEEDGSFPQNFWVDGQPFRKGEQLDEVAFPVLLAWRLQKEARTSSFDPRVMVRRALNFLLKSGPVTGEERWEEASGYSPSTLAAIIAAFICGAAFEREAGDRGSEAFLESYADFLRAHLEDWTVTSTGYFARLNPAKPGEVAERGDLDKAVIQLTSQQPEESGSFAASEIVDAGFLQLVRYGILDAHDPVVVKSLRVVDETLKTELPGGPGWRRYNHDGYGQRPDGAPYRRWGKGRSWPLLTGERAHYELAAGGDYRRLVHAVEAFGGKTCLLPEQVWDEPDLPEAHMRCGGATGSAMPLVWAHSEYLRLLRSCHDGLVFDLIPEVEQRYLDKKAKSRFEFWLQKHPIRHARRNCVLRICAQEAFRLRWTKDNWASFQDAESKGNGVGSDYCDLGATEVASGVEFTFFWKERQMWEGSNYRVGAESE